MASAEQYIIFELGSEDFGIKITEVQEIIKPQEVTKLPQSADFIEGIINLRGELIIIIDLRKRLGFETDTREDARILIVNMNGQGIGFVVDDASEVISISDDVISETATGITGIRDEFLSGVGKLENRLIILLNLNRLLTSKEKGYIEEVLDNDDVISNVIDKEELNNKATEEDE